MSCTAYWRALYRGETVALMNPPLQPRKQDLPSIKHLIESIMFSLDIFSSVHHVL